VIVGTGLPMIASQFAQRTHAPMASFIVESGPVDPQLLPVPIFVTDRKIANRAVRLGSTREVMSCMLQRGLVDLGFIGGAQIDIFGNINSSYIGDWRGPRVRLPGSGGANDIATNCQRILIITRHEKRRFPEKVDFITSPGYLDGLDGRRKAGLKVTKPDITLVTELAVMEIDKNVGKFRLAKLMPQATIEEVFHNTGFRPLIDGDIDEVKKPTLEQIRILRTEIDPEGIYLKKRTG